MDMVAVKKKDCDIDMEKRPAALEGGGDFVYAEGTSLGGDDGIAVAYILALLDSEEIAHPALRQSSPPMRRREWRARQRLISPCSAQGECSILTRRRRAFC